VYDKTLCDIEEDNDFNILKLLWSYLVKY